MRLAIHTIENAPAESRPLLAGIADDMGMVPNLVGTAAMSPALLAGFDGIRRAAGSTKLDPVLREAAGVAVGVVVDNRYGVAFHSIRLGQLGLAEDDIQALRDGATPADPTVAVVASLAREIAQHRGAVTEQTLNAAHDAGLSDETILEILLECAFAGTVGLIDNIAGHVELDGMLAARAWTPQT